MTSGLQLSGDDIAHGLLAVTADRRIVGWNRAFDALLAGEPERRATADLDRLGGALVARGLLRARTAMALARRLTAGRLHGRLRLGDGRVLEARTRHRDDGTRLAEIEDVTESWRRERHTARLVRRDALTGLANRAGLEERLARETAGGDRGQRMALFYLDLDRFKPVNDTLGHAVGDALLRAVAGRLRRQVRGGDTVSRLGGDEFAILATLEATADDAAVEAQAARLADICSRTYLLEGHQIDIGASVGVAVARAGELTGERLKERADVALYAAKRAGGATWRVFDRRMLRRLDSARRLKNELQTALPLRQFEVHYQPQLDFAGGGISGFEALVRWRHPTRGVIGPDRFIPAAERSGLINDLGAWVLTTACMEAVSWTTPATIAVNLSPVQFRHPRLVGMVARALEISGLAPERLMLEITESALLRDEAANGDIIDQLKRLGARIAMDDFGTGYSSLTHLQLFPFDKIKLDRSFVAAVGDNHRARAIVEAVSRLGADLGMATVAEGVETPEQMRRLGDTGYSAAQGFLIGRPAPATDLLGFFGRRWVRHPAAAQPLMAGVDGHHGSRIDDGRTRWACND
ncbi:MAG: putative bifunctional diguanylate cyclase/phosphodiesterase [Alphaproteobacteria bacterium]